MSSNFHLLNPDKTKVMVFGTKLDKVTNCSVLRMLAKFWSPESLSRLGGPAFIVTFLICWFDNLRILNKSCGMWLNFAKKKKKITLAEMVLTLSTRLEPHRGKVSFW